MQDNSNVRIADGGARLTGYAAIFGVIDKGGDIVMPGAFQRALAEPRAAALPLLWQHDQARPIGRIVSAQEDRTGLRIAASLVAGNSDADDAMALVQARALTGLSFGYRVRRQVRDRASNVRRLLDIDLIEVSLVTFPMQPRARVTAVA